MHGQTVSLCKLRFRGNWGGSLVAMAHGVIFGLTLLTTHPMQAQTFSVLHYFTEVDGANPIAGVTVGPGGVLYGTAGGGPHGTGLVFKLSRVNSGWVLSPLYQFGGGGVAIGSSGALYSTTESRGADYGTVFELRPPLTVCKSVLCYWNETLLYSFAGTPDGEYPYVENLAFDPAGNIYGTTLEGGRYGGGTTFELTHVSGGYTENLLHDFGSGTDGATPYSGVVLDSAGNVYGTTANGGAGEECDMGCGIVYQLMPSNGGWVENVLVTST